ncbi:hypothetical protein BT93_K1178 [Corymbia citriodora subsp. variegata]|nr:hypothetical protein BT93_K1178 [Corymbia citriodora subsp. variegata]
MVKLIHSHIALVLTAQILLSIPPSGSRLWLLNLNFFFRGTKDVLLFSRGYVMWLLLYPTAWTWQAGKGSINVTGRRCSNHARQMRVM